ncbi:hypothetical protein HZI73_03170 [Vallitalea pronyensis]|uniref:DUF6273 domain-containing protein n=1 Tax=Vallitalea pronyensis TaxID=1348613 RepID=A0A8J8SFK3_9FIRM|nr:hypothetical protein [Vallitalea pronyensis]QUI21343.1 hypothetical protein HZI73_03170 [Vallitalea pronyensis]
MNKKMIYLALWIGCIVTVCLLLYYPKFVGVGDNSDFDRVMKPIGLKVDVDKKYDYAQSTFAYNREWYNLGEHLSFISSPDIKVDHPYHSTQFIVLKIAGFINGFYQYMTQGVINTFEIWTLAILYMGIFGLAVSVFIRSIPLKNTWAKTLLSILFIGIFFDKGYILYFNSFYGEPLILVSFLLYVASTLVILKEERVHGLWYVLSFLAGGLFIGAKVANIPLGVLMICFALLLYWKKKDKSIRRIIILGSVCLFLTSLYFYTTVPEWMNHYNRYHAVFYGILKDSPHPIEDLRDLGIDEQYVTLKDTHAYMDHGEYDIHSDAFSEAVYDRATPLRVSIYYLTHPKRLWHKMQVLARSSTIIRPPYVGNYLEEDHGERLVFDRRFSSWETLRKKTHPYALLMVMVIGLLYSITSVLTYRKYPSESNGLLVLAFRIMLLLFAMSQFILPVIGNGEADLVKHMFLFNMIVDMLIILTVMDSIRWLEKRYYKPLIVLIGGLFSLVIIIHMFTNEKSPAIITMGRFNNKPIHWEVLEQTGNDYLIAAKDIVTFRTFDEQLNRWHTSTLRQWLNSDEKNGFLYGFTEDEKRRIQAINRKTILALPFKEQADEGSKPFYWYPVPGDVRQNYFEAYGNINLEKVFILGVWEYEAYDLSHQKGHPYWLRTPYANNDMARIVDTDGFVYHKGVHEPSIGVVPCMVITITK